MSEIKQNNNSNRNHRGGGGNGQPAAASAASNCNNNYQYYYRRPNASVSTSNSNSSSGGGQRSHKNYRRAPRFQNRLAAGLTLEKSNQAVLNTDQVQRLYAVMQEPLEVHGRGNYPTLFVCLRRFIRCVVRRLESRGLKVRHVKLNGGAASYVLATKTLPSYNDIDLIFDVDLSPDQCQPCSTDSSGEKNATSSSAVAQVTAKFDLIKHSVFDALIEFLPPGVNRSKICAGSMKNAYVRKMVKVCDGYQQQHPSAAQQQQKQQQLQPENDLTITTKTDGDVWSLISLNNDQGRFLELKFVERMRRQFEFSVDSFQIDLDPVIKRERLRSYDDDNVLLSPCTSSSSTSLSSSPVFLSQQPSSPKNIVSQQSSNNNNNNTALLLDDYSNMVVTAESMYGNFQLALKHLNQMLIDTVQPELIRGGGLLKYVNLLVRGFKPACSARECYRMERYMCSRFFIDFSTVDEQQRKLRAYLDNHFDQQDLQTKYDYLLMLRRVVDESTVCLMNHELRMSLDCIDQLAFEVHMEMCYERQLAACQEAMTNVLTFQQQQQGNHHYYNKTNGSGGTTVGNYCFRCRRPSSAGSGGSSSSSGAATNSANAADENFSSSNASAATTTASCSLNSSVAAECCADQCGCDGNQVIQQQQQQQQQQPKPMLMFIPHNASYWIPVI